jgi:hypothetical protein
MRYFNWAKRRGPPFSLIAQFWSLALGPSSWWSPENFTHPQAVGALKLAIPPHTS